MGRRKGKTGRGGAVVSSLSKNAGGRVVSKDSVTGGEASSSIVSAGWVGKTPVVFLREWCLKNDRRRPVFRPMRGEDGIMSCKIPPGRRKGTGKPKGFEMIIGIGAHPGEEWAALRVLHQVERGKPLERILPPDFRDAWKEMDATFADMEKQRNKREFLDAKRKKRQEREVKRDQMDTKTAIKVGTNDRIAIEDALQSSKVESKFDTFRIDGGDNRDSQNGNDSEKLEKELVRLGFSPLDATAAATRFGSRGQALDFLCMNLDENELPPSFAPRAEISVIRFAESEVRANVDTKATEILADRMSVSKLAAERALRQTSSDRDIAQALLSLYRNLTNITPKLPNMTPDPANVKRSREEEEEALKAIFAEDICIGHGAEKEFEFCWAAVVTIGQDRPVLGSKAPVNVVFVDGDGLYPYSSPVVYVRGKDLPSARRRAIIRAAATEVESIRKEYAESEEPYGLVCAIVQYLANLSEQELLKAGKTFRSNGTLATLRPPASSGSQQVTKVNQPKKRWAQQGRRIEKPRRVYAPRPSAKLDEQIRRRSRLPAFDARKEILDVVASSNVVVVSGATGSGKTTQVPQYLLEEAAEKATPISIVCTQPRRIAAMSVAQRVASERCERIGESVGYQVKLDSKSSGNTRLIFCTTGVLLRRLQSDPSLDALTHVIVDEVHERSVDTDFLLIILRDLLKRRPMLRVILMSATLNAKKFSDYFFSAGSTAVPVVSISGRTYPVDNFYLEDVVALTNYEVQPGDMYTKKQKKRAIGATQSTGNFLAKVSATELAAMHDPIISAEEELEVLNGVVTNDLDNWDDEISEKSQTLRVDPSDKAKETADRLDESLVNLDLIERLIRGIVLGELQGHQPGSGAILVFLPGIADIMALMDRLGRGVGAGRLYSLPLHSSLSPEAQSLIFDAPPKGRRKVICSTNIAETSVTVPDVTSVIDTLRAKQMSFDSLNSTSMLDEMTISRAEARQRAGRAGRVSRGSCFRLVTRRTFENKLRESPVPEIQRISLEHLVLNIMSLSEQSPESMLGNAIDPPDPKSVSQAILGLRSIGAVTDSTTGDQARKAVRLTPLGRHLALLPVDAKLGKLLVYGAIFGCLSSALTIAATLACGSPFISPLDRREEARVARDRFSWGRSDLLTFARVYDAWQKERRSARFCRDNFVSRKSMITIEQQRRLLLNSVSDAGFGDDGMKSNTYEHSDSGRLLRALTCAALYPNLVRADALETRYQATASGAVEVKAHGKMVRFRARDRSRVFVHPGSVIFGHESELEYGWIAYLRRVRTTKDYMREISEVSPISILLFGGDIHIEHEKGRVTVGEGQWASFKASAREAVLVKELRCQMDALLEWKLENPGGDINERGTGLNQAVIKLIKSQL